MLILPQKKKKRKRQFVPLLHTCGKRRRKGTSPVSSACMLKKGEGNESLLNAAKEECNGAIFLPIRPTNSHGTEEEKSFSLFSFFQLAQRGACFIILLGERERERPKGTKSIDKSNLRHSFFKKKLGFLCERNAYAIFSKKIKNNVLLQ